MTVDFLTFARDRGVLIDSLPPLAKWCRYPTEDKPRSDNGAVKFMGDHGFVQNHATMTGVEVWKADRDAAPLDRAKLQRDVKAAEEDKRRLQAWAAERAANIVSSCVIAGHPYLARKGFPDAQGMVYKGQLDKESPVEQLLVIPMRNGDRLVGAQRINAAGAKKFVYGQASAGAEFRFAGNGPELLCEGYATALSIQAALAGLRATNPIRVCFSAFNIQVISERLSRPHAIVADNDLNGVGARYPKEAGIPFWISDKVGEDFNDYTCRVRTFKAGQSLRTLLQAIK
jgi:putative DNA primase/helicase